MRRTLRIVLERIDAVFDTAFTPSWNPMLQLGAMGWFFYWIVIVSGIYLYIFFDTGIEQAYASVEYLTHTQWYLGGIIRSLHRYASDALVVVVLLHIIREFILDRFRGVRWFAWVTGVALLWLLYASGISGYWVVWDTLAQYIAIGSSEWFDSLNLFGEPIARNFLNSAALNGRFFTLLIFIHIAAPLFLLFGMWIHIQRHNNPKVNPPKGLAAGTLLMLIVLSLVNPALSQDPANLDVVPTVLNIDWYYLFIYPLLDYYPGQLIWGVLIGATVLLSLLPWLPRLKREAVATVNLDYCNGCARCSVDCPYSAISMLPRTDGSHYDQQAAVNPDLCVSCGICMGACPTATPYRRQGELIPGIQLPDHNLKDLKETVLAKTQKLDGPGKVLVFSCNAGPELAKLEDQPDTAVIKLPCIGMLPPPLLDFTISKRYASGVFLTGCRENNCHHRLGIEWTQQRIDRERDPYLRDRVDRNRLGQYWAGVSGEKKMEDELQQFRQALIRLDEQEQSQETQKQTEAEYVET